MELASFACPRCHESVRERFYGPCTACRETLVATMRKDAAEIDAAAVAYEPKMNVVPNQVATKD